VSKRGERGGPGKGREAGRLAQCTDLGGALDISWKKSEKKQTTRSEVKSGFRKEKKG